MKTKDGGSSYDGTGVMASIRAFKVFKTKDKSAYQNPDQKISTDEKSCSRVEIEIL